MKRIPFIGREPGLSCGGTARRGSWWLAIRRGNLIGCAMGMRFASGDGHRWAMVEARFWLAIARWQKAAFGWPIYEASHPLISRERADGSFGDWGPARLP